MHANKSDKEIIISYKNGEKEIFKELIDRYTSPLFNFTARLTNKDEAPDILQDVFIKVWKNLDSFDISKSSFKTWVFTVTKNSIIDFWRKSKNKDGQKKILSFSDIKNTNNDFSFSENIEDGKMLPNEKLEKLEDKEFLNSAIEKLPENYKTVLILHYQEEMTFGEIGKVLEKPLNTVKSYHQRAIISLRKTII